MKDNGGKRKADRGGEAEKNRPKKPRPAGLKKPETFPGQVGHKKRLGSGKDPVHKTKKGGVFKKKDKGKSNLDPDRATT